MEKVIQALIYEFIRSYYGVSEAKNPSYNIKELSKYLSKELEGNFEKNYKDIRSSLNTVSHKEAIKGILSYELGTTNEKLLNNIYDEYMENDYINLISDEIYDTFNNLTEEE